MPPFSTFSTMIFQFLVECYCYFKYVIGRYHHRLLALVQDMHTEGGITCWLKCQTREYLETRQDLSLKFHYQVGIDETYMR